MAPDIYSTENGDEEMLLIRDRIDLFRASSRGVSSSSVKKLLQVTGLRKDVIASIMSISVKTLDRYLASPVTLPPSSSELLIKISELYRKGEKVLGSIENFREWMTKPSFGLTGLVPSTLLTTASGIDLISEELGRIEFGDLS